MREKMADTGAVEESSGVAGIAADTSDTDNDNSMAPPTSLAEQLRLAERGVAVHDISGDETEDETLLDEKDDEVEGGGGDISACADDASAALLDTTTDQEGLVLTGGDWFKTIKKELAERMKKAKISQMFQATLENEVLEGNPPYPRPADASPSALQKNSKKSKIPLPVLPPAPPWLKKKLRLLIRRTDVPLNVGSSFKFPPQDKISGSTPPPLSLPDTNQ